MSDDGTEYDRYDEPRVRARPPLFALVGLLVGVVLGLVLAGVLAGNPFSDTNRVTYQDIVVGSIEPDRICWSADPDRRDADQECAILAVDPSLAVPQVGDSVTVGVVPMRAPDGSTFRQVAWVGGRGTSPGVTPPAGTTTGTPDATPDATRTP
jgi:hypothetical protein